MSEYIEHSGVMVEMNEGHTVVRILQNSACSGCSVAQLCKSSESQEKLVDVYGSVPPGVEVGSSVLLAGTVQQSLRAVLWAYVFPLVLLVAALALLVSLTGNESLSALVVLALMAIYYFVLGKTMRNRFSRELSFRILNTKQ